MKSCEWCSRSQKMLFQNMHVGTDKLLPTTKIHAEARAHSTYVRVTCALRSESFTLCFERRRGGTVRARTTRRAKIMKRAATANNVIDNYYCNTITTNTNSSCQLTNINEYEMLAAQTLLLHMRAADTQTKVHK